MDSPPLSDSAAIEFSKRISEWISYKVLDANDYPNSPMVAAASNSSLRGDVRALKNELLTTQKNLNSLSKFHSINAILLDVVEENFKLKKDLEKQQNNTKHLPRSKDEEKIQEILKENSALKDEVKYYKEKYEESSKLILEMQSEMGSLRSESLEEDSPFTHASTSIMTLTKKAKKSCKKVVIKNKKISFNSKDQKKDVKICFPNSFQYDGLVYFDPNADVNICGPIYPPPYQLKPMEMNLKNEKTISCLGTIKVKIMSKNKVNKAPVDTTLHVFSEVQNVFLCRKDWKGIK